MSAGEPRYGWAIVAVGALMTCVAFGAVFALAVFLQPMADATGWSRAGISGAMTLVFLAMGVGGFVWGTLSDRFGARPVVLAASVLLVLGLALASRAASLLQFQLAYGLLVGFAAGGFFPPFIAVVSNWFDRHRALAVSLTTAGVGVAPMTMSPFAGWLLTAQDWRGAQLTIAILAALVLVPASLLVRQPPAAPAGAWSFAAGLAQPIYRGGQIDAQRDAALARERAALAAYQGAIRNAFGEVRQARAAQSRARESFDAQGERADALQATLRLAKLRYAGGLASQLEVLDAERGLLAAQNARFEALRAQRAAVADLYRALGG